MSVAKTARKALSVLLGAVLVISFSLPALPQRVFADDRLVSAQSASGELPRVFFVCAYDNGDKPNPRQSFGKKTISFSMNSGYAINRYTAVLHKGGSDGKVVAKCKGSVDLTSAKWRNTYFAKSDYSNKLDFTNLVGKYTWVYDTWYYDHGWWPGTTTESEMVGNAIKKTSFSVKRGKSVSIPYVLDDYHTRNKSKVTFKKVSGEGKVKVSKAGKVTPAKSLAPGTYKVKVKAYMDKNLFSVKTLSVKVS